VLSKYVTVPVGVPPVEVTVAVNVTDCPRSARFRLEVRAVAVGALFTVCCTAEEALVAWVESPPYVAVIACTPTLSAEVGSVVCPTPFSVPVPIVIPASLKVMFPVATVKPLVTVAPNVTRSSKKDGFFVDVREVEVRHTPLDATTAVNGVFVSPVVVMFRISTPGSPPVMAVPTRNLICTLFPANCAPRFTVTGIKLGQ
jgi:hypothetical protein